MVMFVSNRDEYWSNTQQSFIFNKYVSFNKKYINLFSYIFSFLRICNAFTKNGGYFQLDPTKLLENFIDL